MGKDKTGFKQKEVQDEANDILEPKLRKVIKSNGCHLAHIRDLQDQKDIGIDYQVEIVDKKSAESIITFSLQSKGQERKGGIQSVKNGAGAGKISFSIEKKHVWYYRRQRPDAVLIVLTDTVKEICYWHPIQLDNEVEETILSKPDQDSISIYFDPTRILAPGNMDRLLEDIRNSNAEQSFRYNSNPPGPLLPAPPPPTGRMLDDAYNVLSEYYKVLNYIPLRVLLGAYPFVTENTGMLVAGGFRQYTNNADFFNLFKGVKRLNDYEIEIVDDTYYTGVNDAKAKMQQIMVWLTHNHIYHIALRRGLIESLPTFLLSNDDQRLNLLHQLRSLNYFSLFTGMRKGELNNMPKIVRAYIQGQVGNYVTAQNILKELANDTKTGTLAKYIAYANRYDCHYPIKLDYENLEGKDKMLREIKGVPLEITLIQCYNPQQKAAIEWIHRNKFIEYHETEMMKVVNKIKDTYYGSLNGTISDNTFLATLQGEYAAFEGFISENYLLVDRYFQFSTLTNLFAEGMLMSYAIEPGKGTRLEQFDDWVLWKLVSYATPDQLLKIIKMYKVRDVTYVSSSEGVESFLQLAGNLMQQPGTISDLFESVSDGNKMHWERKFNNQLGNIFVMAAVLELEPQAFSTILDLLLKSLKINKSLLPYFFQYVIFFLERRADKLQADDFKAILIIACSNPKYQNVHNAFEISALIERSGYSIEYSADEFDLLLQFFFENANIQYNIREVQIDSASWLAGHFSNQVQKKEWLLRLAKSLAEHFNTNAYSYLSDTGLFPHDKQQFQIYTDQVLERVKKELTNNEDIAAKGKMKPDILTHYPVFRWLNDLLVLSAKHSVEISQENKQLITDLHPYYKWLLDIDGFNYSEFDSSWIKFDLRKTFTDQYVKSAKLRNTLETYLINNDDPKVMKVFFKIFYKAN